MITFHGYPLDSAQVPERPWWRSARYGEYERLDGLRISIWSPERHGWSKCNLVVHTGPPIGCARSSPRC